MTGSAAKPDSGNLDVALALAKAGLPIFPAKVSFNETRQKWIKEPRIKGWQQEATTNAQTLRDWWCTWPDAVPGIELGRTDLIIIDTDRHGAVDGVANFAALVAQHVPLANHPIAKTAGGGEHHYFKQWRGESFGNSEGALRGKGIDVRGKGGWVVAPGSVRSDGKRWQPAGLITAFHNGSIPLLPDWLAAMIRPARKAEAQTKQSNEQRLDRQPWSEAEEARVQDALRRIPSDTRDTWLRVGAALHWTGWPTARTTWDAWSQTTPGAFDADDQEKTWESFDRPYNGTPVTLGSLFHLAEENGWTRKTNSRQEVAQEPIAPLPWINMTSWDTEPVPEQEWAVLDRIPLRQCALFSGEGAAGKSTTQLHLSVAHVLGRDWLGTLPEYGPAIYIDAEDDEKVLHRRLAAIVKHYQVTFSDVINGGLHLMSFAGHDAVLAAVSRSGRIEPTARYKQLLEAAGDIKPKMIGIASSPNVYAGSEIDRSQVQQFISLLTRLPIVANGSLVLISHPSLTGISTDTGLSGNTQWHNAMRARFYMKSVKPEAGEQPDSDLREIVFKKNNYGRVSASIVLRYQNGLFLPVPGLASLDQAAREARADEIFLDLLLRFATENRYVSDKKSPSYAPAVFAKEDMAKKAGITSTDLAHAMRRLFAASKVWNEPCGRPSRPSYRIARKP